MVIAPGATSVTIEIQIVDDTGLPVTGLVSATMPSIYYSRAGETLPSAITTSDLAAQNSSYSSGGVKELAAGYYRLDVPNAAFATAAKVFIFGEASGKRVIFPGGSIDCMNVPADAKAINAVSTSPVTTINANFGTTQPVNFTGATSAALIKSDSVFLGGQTASAAGTVTLPGMVASPTNITAGTITTVTNLTNAPTAGDFTATMKTSIGTAVAASAVASVTGNVGGNVAGTVATVTNLTNAPGAGDFTATMKASISTALLDLAAGVETGLTVRQFFRLVAAVLFGKSSGGGTTSIVFRDTGDSKDRVTATVDSSSNRTAMTTDAT